MTEHILEPLKRLCLEYQKEPSTKLGNKILKRVDRLVVSHVYKLVDMYKILQKVPINDIYHTAVVGVFRGVLTVKEDEQPCKVPARLIAYLKCEVKQIYTTKLINYQKYKDLYTSDLEARGYFGKVLADREVHDKDSHIDAGFVFKQINNLIDIKVILAEDFDMFYDKYVMNISYNAIAEKYELPKPFVSARIQKVRRKLLKYIVQ